MISDVPQPGGPPSFDAFCRSLLAADWTLPDGPLRFNAELRLADLAGADFCINARVFLGALEEAEGAATTGTGNLNRVFVRQMFDRMKFAKRFRDSVLSVCKLINEHDVWPLHLVRVVTECAGLVVKRKKLFTLTKAGRGVLADDQAGVLFRSLFLAYFRRFDLHYDCHDRDVPGIQETMAVILWRLDTVARDWTAVQGLGRKVLLPGVLAQLHGAMCSPYEKEEWILAGYVLEPLSDFGLVERKVRGESWNITEKDFIKTTTLWRKFIDFDWDGGPR